MTERNLMPSERRSTNRSSDDLSNGHASAFPRTHSPDYVKSLQLRSVPETSHPTDDDRTQWSPTHTSPTTYVQGRRRSSVADAVAGSRSPQELFHHVSQSNQRSTLNDVTEVDPRTAHPGLDLSGNVISATFCVPYKINYGLGGEWELSPRRGTSAMFDSFSHLTSPKSTWNHTLVGWTGEVGRLPDSQSTCPKVNGYDVESQPCQSHESAPIPVDANAGLMQQKEMSDLFIPHEDRKRLEIQLERHYGGRIAPVWLADETDAHGTFKLSNGRKWRQYGERELFTLFHYKYNEPSDGGATKKAWDEYTEMNEAFANAIIRVYKPGDVVVVHDYQLLLLPQLLRARVPNIYVGFFLHVPFPSTECYRSLTQRAQILNGALGANMVGFQAFSYARHFSAACTRILKYDSSPAGVDTNDMHVALDVLPIGLDTTRIENIAFGSPAVEERMAALREKYAGKKIIVGRDRLDTVRGVAQKLRAFEIFLERHPEWHGKVVLIQVTSPTSIANQNDKNERTASKIDDTVSRINGNFGSLNFMPVHYFPQYLSKEEYFALLRIADLGLITSVRDGMNTTALEYVICQQASRNPLIISEFSGTVGILADALHVNPLDFRAVASAIDRGLTMSEGEKQIQHERLYQSVTDHSVQNWTSKFLKRLLTNVASFNRSRSTPFLDREKLLNKYRTSKRRLFMFDYDGTLTPIIKDPEAALPSENLLDTIRELAADPKNAVWIISGRSQKFLDQWMGHIPTLGLSAEHGCFIRMPNSTEWDNLTAQFDMDWHDEVIRIFGDYTESTPHAFIEKKVVALTWHYRTAIDPEWANSQALKLRMELQNTVAKQWDVEVMAGKANVEVRPRFVNKGEIAKRLVQDYGEGEALEPDFVMCAGDDFTDEDMFRSLRCSKLNPDHVFAVTIGASTKQTLAYWHLEEPDEVVSAIALLNNSADGGNTVPVQDAKL